MGNARAHEPRAPGHKEGPGATRRPTASRDARAAPRLAGSLAGAGGTLQARLTIGAPGDRYEREADAVAQHVVSGGEAAPAAISRLAPGAPAGPTTLARQQEEEEERVQTLRLQRQEDEKEEEEPVQTLPLQRQEDEEEEEEPVQTLPLQRQEGEEEEPVQAAGAPVAPAPSPQAISAVRAPGAGSPMAPGTRATLETGMGADLSGVRVHEGSRAGEATRSIRARAFTYGRHIWLGRGESQSDLRLMAHEATHAVQQGAAVQRAPRPLTIGRTPARVQRGLWDSLVGAATSVGSAVVSGVTAVGSAVVSGAEAVGSAVVSGAKAVAGGALALAEAAKRRLLGLIKPFAHAIPGYPLLTVILGRDPITDEVVERNATNLVHGFLSLIPGGDAIFQRIQESGALQKTFSWISEQVAQLDLGWEKIKSLFRRAWESLGPSDIVSPGAAWAKIQDIFGPPIARIIRFAAAIGEKVKEFIFEAALRLAGPMAAKVMGFIQRAGDAVNAVFSDPIGFLKNLLAAVVKGFTQFKDNILSHLQKGLLGWLFGALEGAGIELPETFDLKGIVSLVLQVLGLTYQRIRAKLVDRFGEEAVARIEQGVEFVKVLLTEGLAGAWQKIVEFFGDLKETVMGAIRNWVITKIVTSAVTKLASMFNPVGAIIQAVITIYNVIAFFVERFKQIIDLANSVFESIANVAAGKIDAAANYIEETMSRTLPVIISFLASLIGLGGISGKIRGIIKELQKRVDKVVDKVLDFIIEKGKALLGAAKKGVGKVKETAGKLFEWWKTRKKFKAGGESHALYFTGEAAAARLTVASEPITFEAYLETLKTKGASEKQLDDVREKHGEIQAEKQGSKPGEQPSIGQSRGKKIEGLLGELAALLGGVGTSESRPPSRVTFGTTTKAKSEVGKKMTAKPLTMVSGGTSGSEPHETNPLWEAVRARNLAASNTYIRGHLLNHHLHGPGENRNLTPITGKLNTQMSAQVEEKAKDAVLKNNAVVSYTVDVAYGGHGGRTHIPEESELATTITLTLRQMRPKKGREGELQDPDAWTEGKPDAGGPRVDEVAATLTHELPPDTEAAVGRKRVNLSTSDAADIGEIPVVKEKGLAGAIVTKRKEVGGSFTWWDEVGLDDATTEKLKTDGYVSLRAQE